MNDSKTPPEGAHLTNFIRQHIERDLEAGKYSQRRWGGEPGPAEKHAKAPLDPAKIRTRFPPEPNGYLHIGHAKSICLNFGIAEQYGGICHMRFDDTNPEKEEQEFVDGILDAVHWLGYHWGKDDENLYHASDYFAWMYDFAVELIKHGDAYVDSQTADEIRATRGTFSEHGIDSPHRKRSVEENLKLFDEMKNGKHADGSHVLRAKIDMKSPNINMRDPAIYRIKNAEHHRTGNTWHIYPDVLVRAPDRGRAREHHAFAVHARVRGPAAVLRLGAGADRELRVAAAPAPAADRVLAPQSHLHGDEQAVLEAAGRRGPRRRLGRSAHADDRGRSPPRLHARGDSACWSSAWVSPRATPSSSGRCSRTASARC
jgi:hypothetical protein